MTAQRKKNHLPGMLLLCLLMYIFFYGPCDSTPTPSPKKGSTSVNKADDEEAALWSAFEEIDYEEERKKKSKLYIILYRVHINTLLFTFLDQANPNPKVLLTMMCFWRILQQGAVPLFGVV